VHSDERRSASGRIDIYASMYFARIRDVLGDMFPQLQRQMGAERFLALVRDYLHACPSCHPSLRHVGGALPQFLDEHTDSAQPWLADLARLEWTRHDLHDLADAEPLELEALRTLTPEAFAELPLELVPAARLIELGWAVDESWAATETTPMCGARQLLVWRPDVSLMVLHRALDEREAEAMRLVERGTTFGLVCEWLAGELEEAEAAQAGFALLGQWATDRVIRDPTAMSPARGR
jgi:hypothetical protein